MMSLGAWAQPVFTQQFDNDTIGPGSHTWLRYTITNNGGQNATQMAFTNVLPASVTIGAQTQNACQGTLTAPSGGDTITLTDGELPSGQSCQIAVSVTSNTVGIHMNVSGDLTSSQGNSGTSSDDLNVENSSMAFSLSASPNSIQYGSPTTLTFLLDNTLNSDFASNPSFTMTLPPGVEFDQPNQLTTDCQNLVMVADDNNQTLSTTFSNALIPAGDSCTINVDVLGLSSQDVVLATSIMTHQSGFNQATAGFAEAELNINASELLVVKSFTDDPATVGGSVTLQYEFSNRNRNDAFTALQFTDDFTNVANGLTINTVTQNTCGFVVTGGTSLTANNGNLGSQQDCQLTLTLDVPVGATSGTHTSTSSSFTYDVMGQPGTTPAATANLVITEAPLLSMQFIPNPVATGNTVQVEYTVTNTSAIAPASNIAFTHQLVPFFPFPANFTLPANGYCGGSSQATVTIPNTDEQAISFTGGDLPPGGSCVFTLGIDVPVGMASSLNDTNTSNITATVNGINQIGNQATAQLDIISAPQLTHEFTDDPVLPGAVVDLEYTLTLGVESAHDATDITFSHDLNAVVAGLTAVGLPINDVCGNGSSISGTTNLTLSAGTLTPGTTCTFNVSVQVPGGAALGSYPSTTSTVNATMAGVSTSNLASADTLVLSAIEHTMEFIPDTTYAGVPETITIRHTLTNLDTINDATAMSFSNNINTVISGWDVVGLPVNDVCGAGSQLNRIALGFYFLSGGNLTAGASCTFDVTSQLPNGTTLGSYTSSTSTLTATINGSNVVMDPASDTLEIIDAISFTHEFTDDPVAPGDTVTLAYTLTNESPTDALTNLSFTNDLDATLSGLVATGLPASNTCGAGSTLTGTNLLTFTGGQLAAGASCTFNVTLQVPANAPLGGQFINTTSTVSGQLNGNPVSGPVSSDQLFVYSLSLTKSFSGDVFAGQTATLTFVIENLDNNNTKLDISFTDDLNAMIPGAMALGLPVNGVCGAQSQLTGGSMIQFSQGELAASSSCQFDVLVQIPTGATAGIYTNTTSQVSDSGLIDGGVATADLRVNVAPAFQMQWQPGVIALSQTSQATYTIDNSGSTLAADALSFTNNLPAGLTVATPANGSTTCTGGTLTATPGTGTITYSGGQVAAASSCQITVDVSAGNAGQFVNTTSDLLSNAGNSGPASDTLTVESPPLFSKAFAPATALANQAVTLTFTIDNSANTLDATALDFLDAFPSGMTVANPANANTTCTGGTLTAATGAGSMSYTGGTVSASSTCTVSLDVVSITQGLNQNVSGDLTSSHGNSGHASADLTIESAPTFSKAFLPNTAVMNEVVTLTFTIENGSGSDATNLDFTDNFPAGMTVSNPANASTTCTGGTLTAVTGSGSMGYTGGTVAAASSCTVSVDVSSVTMGLNQNVSGDLTSSHGNSGPASADLTISGLPVFSKTFSETEIFVDQVTTLTLTIDNNATNSDITGLAFTDNLPAGLQVAAPANLNNTCGGTANASGSVIDLTGGSVLANSTCDVQVDVMGTVAGLHTNTTSDLSTDFGTANAATADLTVHDAPVISKTFANNPVNEGDVIQMSFTITNPANVQIDNVSFSDDLDAFIMGAVATGLPQNGVCGAGSSVTGTNLIQVSGVTIPALGNCQITVDVQLPIGITGNHINTTSPIDFTANGQAISGTAGSAGSAPIEVLPAGGSGSVTQVPVNQWLWLMMLAMSVTWFARRRLTQK